MAIFQLNTSVISRKNNKGGCRSVVAFAAYRSGEKIQDHKSNRTYNYQFKNGILFKQIMAPDSAPDWVFNRASLWNKVETTEKRIDAQLARSILLALPSELTNEQRIVTLQNFIQEEFIKLGMIADFAVHAPNPKGDQRNFHAHILLTMRELTADGFGKKNREWNLKYLLYKWRQSWSYHTNCALERVGIEQRIDSRSYSNQGLNIKSQMHLGFRATEMERNGINTKIGNINRSIQSENQCLIAKKRTLNLNATVVDKNVNTSKTTLNIEQDVHNTYKLSIDTITSLSNSITIGINNIELEHSINTIDQNFRTFNDKFEKIKIEIQGIENDKEQNQCLILYNFKFSDYERFYKRTLRSIYEFDLNKYRSKLTELNIEIKLIEKNFSLYIQEYIIYSVRNQVDFVDPKLKDLVNKVKTRELSEWSEFAIKTDVNKWSYSRIQEAEKFFQSIQDRQLKKEISLELKLERGYDRTR